MLRDLSDTHFPEAKKIVLMEDNLNTHSFSTCMKPFPPPGGSSAHQAFGGCSTRPKHGSWLNMAEVRNSACCRLPDHEPALTGIEGRSLDWISGGALARGVDLVLHDAQYLEDEYDSKIGWGHSTVDQAVAFWREVQATQLVLFHHDPDRSDRQLEAIEDRAVGLSPDDRPPPLVAREGLVIELP